MYNSSSSVVVYEGEKLIGEVDAVYVDENDVVLEEIRISHLSNPSERCTPLAVLHSIANNGVCFKLECKSQFLYSQLNLMHSTCLRDNKTAVMPLGDTELHLVAMVSRQNEKQCPCFWGFKITKGLYDSCLVMLNLRCLGIVFDLDETLIVANTMRSFEDRIEALQRKVNSDSDPQRVSGMLAEIKRYQEDKLVLKQYAENDQVFENGKVIKTQAEVIQALSESHQPMVRPIIRLQDKNVILTRINPLIRDTSVLVRLRPAWEDLRSYLIARGRKRFEVFVCTMAERDYALEMWRLLDPESKLINTKEILERIVCVKPGLKKSLFNVFQNGNCNPNLALVIDDRLKVWDEKDQPRVHVVPAFAPYYAPQAEANNAVPVLCVARNVACNVRGGFFKDFDEGTLQRILEVKFEDDVKDIPLPPDVSNYLISEDDASTLNGNKDSLSFDGMADIEVERRLKDETSASPAVLPMVTTADPRLVPHVVYPPVMNLAPTMPTMLGQVMPVPSKSLPQVPSILKSVNQVGLSETNLQNSPAREEGEVPESELDPDTRRRLLILQHGQDIREPPIEPKFPIRPTSLQVSVPQVQGRGNWFPAEEKMSPRQLNPSVPVPPKEFPLNLELPPVDKQQPRHPPFVHKVDNSPPSDMVFNSEGQMMPKEVLQRDERLRPSPTLSTYPSFPGEEVSLARSSSSNRNLDSEPGRIEKFAETPVKALQDIAFKCRTKVEFRSALVPSMVLQFQVEVWFAGERICAATGSTRKEAQRQAAEESLLSLAEKYISHINPTTGHGDGNRFLSSNGNGFIGDVNSVGYQQLQEESPTFQYGLGPSRVTDPRLEGSKNLMGSVSELKELCMMEGLAFSFHPQPQFSTNMGQHNEVYAQVEVDGQVLGKGSGLTWDEAKLQAADKALGSLRSMNGQFSYKRQGSPRSLQGMPNKRFKPEFPRFLQRVSSSSRYPKNAYPMP
ncbi:hypothetical protein DCAR_0831305 [Daucus carota subsp. sativus]|uniref:protein-serine/threonine phosphatase n=1 Tax=Daucus carota subsp. sativus TaxID=79200 RepID=A0A175YLK2_DAUCS|nr:PREDICTED: RNA polymerase II C-terminal domain phosphatase-like 1 [Daucus carota subsp. sativus]WOH11812.1 hypothetical protein DCAR_0831305 [Daucus carota subsp. sativus]